MRIIGLVSSFCEGTLVASALRSLEPLDGVLVFDGPVEGNEPDGPASVIPAEATPTPKVYRGSWASDAAKRTAMLEKAKELWQGELWGLWLDADELLLWGKYLHDWLERVTQQGDDANPVAGWPLPLVELDSTVVMCLGKLVRLDLIRRYLASSSYIEMTNGGRRTVGNVPYWTPRDGPLLENWRARPPLQGEPHLLHRPILRDRRRRVERQHLAEARAFEEIDLGG